MRIIKYIPDCITSMNLLSGSVAVVFALQGRIEVAFPLMILAAVFDFLDGLAARALHAYSDLGKELDSLADVISFGLLPALMLHNAMKVCTFSDSPLCWIPLLIAVFSGIRLARFNVDERQHSSFIGLPTPASAMICGSLSYYVAFNPTGFLGGLMAGPVFVPVLSAVLCALLVCGLPMFSMKFSKDDPRPLMLKRIFFIINVLILAAIVLGTGANWSLAVLLSFALYVLMNVMLAIARV
ncbi:MAG: CDP-diacylglycerol--serine O-phosphatidyltransferase [Bacteroidales bacterium]|nr:CDP-diacylglycerol--serine O-phosphatidyltransferase [Bacteroidales bacterium]